MWVLFPYIGKYRILLTEYKFKKNLTLVNFFVEKIQTILADPLFKDAVIVPVPPRMGKIRETGWDQVEFLVKKIEKLSRGKVSVCRCLKREKSKIQKSLNRVERMEKLKGRITLVGTAPNKVLIIDDVITTGSTIEVCSSVLKRCGAEKVYGLSLFYD